MSLSPKQKQDIQFVRSLVRIMRAEQLTSLELGTIHIVAAPIKEHVARAKKSETKEKPLIINQEEINAMKKEQLIKLATYSVSKRSS